ncbi:MAG: hemerythrin domain-containing protein [Nitrospinae bacterium]|nr:hemerythrin domain-containing protein [Nitrospinota bacterium]
MGEKRLSEVIDLLLSKHHKYLRDIMPVVNKDLSSFKKLSLGPELKGKMDSVDEIVRDVDMDISQHLMKEENILFPTIIDMEEAVLSGKTDGHMGCGAEGPINQMKYEHDIIKESLARLEKDVKDISEMVQKTEHKDKEFVRNFIKNSLEMKEDLLLHIKIEEENLFPAAISLESKMGGGPGY